MKNRWYNWPAQSLLAVASSMALIMVLVMIYEVFARYALNSPTLWAFDISYMLNGCIFLLGCAYALKEETHVRVDFLSSRLKPAVQRGLNAAFYLLVLVPTIGGLAFIASRRAWHAFVTGEVEHVSPWAPVMWPFYLALAVGLAGLTYQLIVDAVLFIGNRKQPGSKEH
ncbi:TRAP transporter small permease subunit [Phytopseudomonas dryadis]|uniref:TRAP transporter small permease protein n=1 Tax=Phytopseudomonas dryadis TaxID=2487520 RepID=A0ABY1Z039_9GAMM|nr:MULTISPECIES: TRAP transporter small permease [Pseudomonas]TBV00597.1 C4-dicarboxylate ABC transporter substrate-binding protein [Pseudomonas dryadis]TBV14491.1 C4-dicarboxylate ABC transporter substrate-binding protein [Pseudomonas sp. FRB 230]